VNQSEIKLESTAKSEKLNLWTNKEVKICTKSKFRTYNIFLLKIYKNVYLHIMLW